MSEPKVFRDYTKAELDAQYNHRHAIPDISVYREQWEELTTLAAERFTVRRDLRYGDLPNQRLDVYEATRPNAPLVVFFHGGAWLRHTKDLFGYPALGFVENGFAFATVEFDVVPDVRLAVQINHALQAVEWLSRQGEQLGYDGDHIYVSGHASGALLAGEAVTTDWRGRLKRDTSPVMAGLMVSGIYDLEPVRLSSHNEALELTAKEVRALSPIHRIPEAPLPVVVAWGESELDEFRRQSLDFAAAWRRADGPCNAVEIPGANHFDMSLELSDPQGPLIRRLIELVESKDAKDD